MEQDLTTPTLAQFKDACRHEFSFLRELGYSELQDSDPADRFNVHFSNGELTLSIRGENWGKHAGVRLFHVMGGKLPSGGSCPCRSARIGHPSSRLGFLSSTTSASPLSRCPATVETCSPATLRNSTR
jgi:hypothetical protein